MGTLTNGQIDRRTIGGRGENGRQSDEKAQRTDDSQTDEATRAAYNGEPATNEQPRGYTTTATTVTTTIYRSTRFVLKTAATVRTKPSPVAQNTRTPAITRVPLTLYGEF